MSTASAPPPPTATVGERHFRRAVAEFVAHDHRERNHQGLDNELMPATRLATYLDRSGCGAMAELHSSNRKSSPS
jgi:hypothetical protein